MCRRFHEDRQGNKPLWQLRVSVRNCRRFLIRVPCAADAASKHEPEGSHTAGARQQIPPSSRPHDSHGLSLELEPEFRRLADTQGVYEGAELRRDLCNLRTLRVPIVSVPRFRQKTAMHVAISSKNFLLHQTVVLLAEYVFQGGNRGLAHQRKLRLANRFRCWLAAVPSDPDGHGVRGLVCKYDPDRSGRRTLMNQGAYVSYFGASG